MQCYWTFSEMKWVFVFLILVLCNIISQNVWFCVYDACFEWIYLKVFLLRMDGSTTILSEYKHITCMNNSFILPKWLKVSLLGLVMVTLNSHKPFEHSSHFPHIFYEERLLLNIYSSKLLKFLAFKIFSKWWHFDTFHRTD